DRLRPPPRPSRQLHPRQRRHPRRRRLPHHLRGGPHRLISRTRPTTNSRYRGDREQQRAVGGLAAAFVVAASLAPKLTAFDQDGAYNDHDKLEACYRMATAYYGWVKQGPLLIGPA